MPKVRLNDNSASVIRFPDRAPITLEPGTHEVSREDFEALEQRGGVLRAWVENGRVQLLNTRSPAERPEPEQPTAPEPEPAYPAWSKRSNLAELQAAAEARGIETEGLTRADLVEALEFDELEELEAEEDDANDSEVP